MRALRQDNRLQAWPWVDGTASWVEPTAWCLLLLKRVRSQSPSLEAAERIRVGEQLLFDRVCHEGGWNYGNSEVYGQKLWPYKCRRQRWRCSPCETIATIQSWFEAWSSCKRMSRASAPSPPLRSRIICLLKYGVATNALEQTALGMSAQADPGNLLGTAMMLYALTDASRQVAFTV